MEVHYFWVYLEMKSNFPAKNHNVPFAEDLK